MESSETPVLYIVRTVPKGLSSNVYIKASIFTSKQSVTYAKFYPKFERMDISNLKPLQHDF